MSVHSADATAQDTLHSDPQPPPSPKQSEIRAEGSVPSPQNSSPQANGIQLPDGQNKRSIDDPSKPGAHNGETTITEQSSSSVESPQNPSTNAASIAGGTVGDVAAVASSESKATQEGSIPDRETHGDKPEGSSVSATLTTGTHAKSPTSRHGTNKTPSSPSTSNGNGKPKASTARSSKPSFFSRLVHILVPCVGPSSRAHPIEITDPPPVASDAKEKIPVKPPAAPESKAEAELAPAPSSAPLKDEEASASAPPVSDESTSVIVVPPGPLVINPMPGLEDEPESVSLPTPTGILPNSETAGLTSGAVQAPGSTGESSIILHEHNKNASRDSAPPSTHGDGDETDGSDFTDDDDLDDEHDMDDADDDEDRIIMNGGAGIPIGPDGIPRPLLPPISPQHAGRKCLVLDLDETLVHSSFKSVQQADYVVPVEIEYQWHNVYVIKRPGVDNFLKKMGEIYEIVVFTASLSKYADPVLDKLDIHQVVSHRLFRESCYNHKGNYVKDLSQLGRPIADTIILDNSPASYIFHPNNAVPVSSWFNDPHDTELTDLVPFLTDLCTVDDVRGVLDGAR